jgi:mono/diheme cytochrome c family protein
VIATKVQTPIESRNYSKYYILFSGLLFLGTMWAVVDEVSARRPWKEYQKQYNDSLAARIEERLGEEIAYLDSLSLEEADAEVQAARDSMRGPVYTDLMTRYNDTLERLIDANREFQFAKSRGDEAYYFYKKSLHEGSENLSEKRRLEENEAEMSRYQVNITGLESVRDSLGKMINTYKLQLRTAQNRRNDILKPVEKWQTKLDRVQGSGIEIKQVMMLDYDRNPFNDPKARVDRCQTCHLGWNEELMVDAVEPFRSHPVPELIAIHNPETFGCTPCHRGQGPALTAGFAHGDGDHYWENPLLKGKDVWASCNECHGHESVLRHAPEFTKAKRLMIESGCFGCHEISGYDDLARIGPELNRLGYKTTPDWIYRWVKEPRSYNPHTRMPNFRLTAEESEAVTAYLMHISAENNFSFSTTTVPKGNVERGKELVESIGCMGCHVVGDNTKVREKRGTSYDIAPELTRVGSKVNPVWAYDWVRNPRHFNPTTKMPSLRLDDGEARDIVSYLMTLKDDREFEPVPVDNIASPAMIRRGEKVIRDYGCAGCHAIQGMEKEGKVSVSLSNFGRKHVEEMDFGDTRVPHTWHDWVYNKLKNSRAFQTERIIQKMPVFGFADDEITSLRMFLLSQTKDGPDPKYVQTFDAQHRSIEEGRRIAFRYNCQQCHQLENMGAHIGALLDDPAYLPPIITGEGKKVQEQWLHNFLTRPAETGKPNSVRPWIPIRMPTFHFTEQEIAQLTNYFLAFSNQELKFRDYAAFRPDPALVPVGRGIFTDFQCSKCHPSGPITPGTGELSTSDLAPRLALARDRLKPEWIVEWLADPGKLQPGTRMPTFFPDGQSPLPEVLDGDARKQMEAIRDYLITIGEPQRAVVSSR